ncbi:hypothetical protein [Mycobacterium sherrisii]|uniref:Uncharacterized protein n=1 Tax=Mycobacterium sherrisii TaxID=243061 RepID=A0A1E3T8Z4_9MYCO|nr:hypothetical protein [Mycobacterium sherrisii]MCV7031787.1 hypothetical protein [Mycobacterium sherrisii]MEC4762989.1 hypothetical protein [Mycobacterium sherrisii]ODR10874.1 hypothetical protein BHQ21_00415 [Mycobacterium sherrisii]ORW86230.1 hypothetical protein AWC25_22230 [Mycobacterium sherrisii]
MRTAVVRLNVDPEGVLTAAQVRDGMAALVEVAAQSGAEAIGNDLASRPVSRREVALLITAEDPDTAKATAMSLCASVFGIDPVPGVVTFVSRGTDDDALGVLSAFGLTGEVERTPGDDGFDVVRVTLREADLERIPESRIHTALEASLNCEVHIRTV